MRAWRGSVPAAITLGAVAMLLLPLAQPSPYAMSFLYLIFFWVTLATSWTILSGFSGYVSFGHGAFYGVGVYAMANLAPRFSIGLGLLIGGALAAALGAGFGAIVFRVKRLRGELFALLTLALAIVLGAIVLNTRIDGGPGISLMAVQLPSFYDTPTATLYAAGGMLALGSMAIARAVQYSRFGVGLFAISDDEDVAEILGVPTRALKIAAFALSSALAGLAGGVHALFVSYVTVGETFSITVPLFVLLMSVLGGARHWLGPTIGAGFVTALTNSLVGGDGALLARGAIGLTLVLATVYLPGGVMGLLQRRSTSLPPVGTQPREPPPESRGRIGEPLFRCTDLQLAFRGVRAIDGVTIEIREGEILGLVGPNGSGKSTFINLVSGLYMPDAGAMELAGQNITRLAGHRRARLGIARTFQIPRPFRRLSVLENVVVAARYGAHSLSQTQALAKAHEILGFVDLAGRTDALPGELNLHQRKFVELARALASGARLILLDEVLAGLTPAEITAAIEMVKRIHAGGATILFVEHNMRAVLALADRLVVLNQGRVIAQGEPRQVMQEKAVISAYLGDADAGR